MNNNNEALIARLERWIDNARRNINNLRDDLADPHCPTPVTTSARIVDYYAKIEAWNEVLKVIS